MNTDDKAFLVVMIFLIFLFGCAIGSMLTDIRHTTIVDCPLPQQQNTFNGVKIPKVNYGTTGI